MRPMPHMPLSIIMLCTSELAVADIAGKDSTPFRTKQHHLVGIRRTSLHARRTGGHARHGKTAGLRSFCEEAPDGTRRDVPIDDIAGHLRCVAGHEVRWHV